MNGIASFWTRKYPDFPFLFLSLPLSLLASLFSLDSPPMKKTSETLRFKGNDPLFDAASRGDAGAVLEFLKQPDLDVNGTKGPLEWTPFWAACFNNHIEIVRIMVQDPRVDVCKPSSTGLSPLMHFARTGNERMIVELVASGRELGVTMAETQFGFTAVDIAKGKKFWKTVRLLEQLESFPQKAVFDCQRRLRLPQVATWFCFVVLHHDGYMKLRKSTGFESPEFRATPEHHRFFQICDRLPIELQMTLCNRLFGLPDSVVTVQQFDQGFRWILLGYPKNHSFFL